MSTPDRPQEALSATQSDEHPLSGLPRSTGDRWALYARSDGLAGPYSHPDTGDIVHSDEIDAQLQPLRALAARRGGTVVAEFVDYGKPGGPERGRLMAGALTGEFDRVALVELSRLARTQTEVAELLGALADIGVGLTLLFEGVAPAHPDGGHDAGRALLTLFSQTLTVMTDHERGRAKEMRQSRRPFGR